MSSPSILEKLYSREEPLTRTKEVEVDTVMIEKAVEHYSGDIINVYEPDRSKAKVFLFGNKFYTCTGCGHLGGNIQWAEIREVVGKEHYAGPERDPWVRGKDFYLGGEVNYNGERYVMTENLIRLIPGKVIEQKSLF